MKHIFVLFVAMAVTAYSSPTFAHDAQWKADKNNGYEQVLYRGFFRQKVEVCYDQGDATNLGVFVRARKPVTIIPGTCTTVAGWHVLVRAYDPTDPSAPVNDPFQNASGRYELKN